MTYAIKAPARYAQGAGELANLGRSAKKLGDKFLVICSDNSRGRFGAQVEASLAEQEKEVVFTTFHGEATKDEVFAKMDECRAQGCDVVVGMGGGKAPAFKPDAAQIRIALNHILHRIGHCASFRVRLGLPSILQQRVPAQLRQSQGSLGAASAGHGHCAGARRSLRFITGRQRITYPCHQKPHRSLSHCQRIHHHHVGIG